MAATTPTGGEHESLRERKRRETRRSILEAVAELELLGGGAIDPSVITYPRIAEIAGVSERTVYRFFPTKADLDRAFLEEQPMLLGLEVDLTDVRVYPDVIEEVGRRWARRTGSAPVPDHEIGIDEYPVSYAARRARDTELVDKVMALAPDGESLGVRQRRAVVAAIQSTLSIRTIAITAQRWNLTIEEATRAHVWTARVLFEALAASAPAPWEGKP